jgi:hypothetical protein
MEKPPMRTHVRIRVTLLSTGNELEALVLWRGSPGWFMRTGNVRVSGGGYPGGYRTDVNYGGVQLDFDILRASPELLEYLRCDAQVPLVWARPFMETACADPKR